MCTMKVKSYCIKIEVVFGNTLKVYPTIRVHAQSTYAYIFAISNYVQIVIINIYGVYDKCSLVHITKH